MSFAREFPHSINIVPPQSVNPEDLQMWIEQINSQLTFIIRELSEALRNIVVEGATADKPTASGSGRFFYDTTLNQLEYDDGSWNVV